MKNCLFRILGIVALSCSSLLGQQQDPNLEQGIKAFGSYQGTEIDSVSLTNGNLIVHIPLFSLPQRGNLKMSLTAYYGAKKWYINSWTPPAGGDPILSWKCSVLRDTSGCGGLYVEYDNKLGIRQTYTPPPDEYTQIEYYYYTITEPDGTEHILRDTSASTMETVDATGIRVNGPMWAIGPGLVIGPDGTRYTLGGTGDNTFFAGMSGKANATEIQDSNGNKISWLSSTSQWKDTLGRLYGTASATTTGCPTGTTSASAVTFPGPNGTTDSLKVCRKSTSVTTAFGVSGVSEYSGTQNLINAVILPDNTKWQFVYNSWGDLTSITYPTGGSISYTWGTSSYQGQRSRSVTARTVNDGNGTSGTWTYAVGTCTISGANVNCPKTVTDPAGNDVVHVNTDLQTSGELYETQTRYYQGSSTTGTLLKTVNTDYSFISAPNAGLDVANLVPTRTTTILEEGTTSKVETVYDSTSDTFYDYNQDANFGSHLSYALVYGKPTLVTAFAYGSGAAGSAIRQTKTKYQAFETGGSSYKTNNLLNLPYSATICEGGVTCDGSTSNAKAQTTFAYDVGSLQSSGVTMQRNASPPTPRGNQTSVSRWLTGTTYLTSSTSYFDTGMPYQATDSGGHTSTIAYSGTFYGAYPTQLTMPTTGGSVTHVTSSDYDFNTGLVTNSTDENGNSTTLSYDSSYRLLQKNTPDGGQVTFSYPTASPWTITASQKITSTMNKTFEADFDGLARVKQTRLTSDPEGTVKTDTTYDNFGRVSTVSNPYRVNTESTYGVTTTQYDVLGRAVKVIPTDGTSSTNNVVTSFSGNCTTVTDQAGKARKTCSDSLGRLVEVREDPATLNYATYYDYDALGNLTCVKQTGGATANQSCGSAPSSWRKRTFTYDALSRLTQAVSPEAGTINYTYDSDSNVATKQDARSITITYSYDQLHRLTGKTYSNSDPSVTYSYDQSSYNGLTITNPKPHRTGMADNTSNLVAWSYDAMGQVLSEKRTVSSITKTTSYTYNLDGSVATLAYPSGRTITYAHSAAGRPLSGIDSANSINYATVATYTPWGALAGVKYGVTGGFTGIVTSNSYNKRLQPSILSAAAPSQTVISLTYDFHLSGSDNNGNAYGITNNRDAYRSLVGSASYSYDALNRLATAASTGTDCTTVSGFTKNWGESFTIDAWGNLNGITTTKCTAQGLSVSDSAYKNQMDQYCYDPAGNLTAQNISGCPGSTLYTYDAENRLKTAGGVTYTYDGDGERVKKSSGTMYWTGMGSDPLTETDSSGNATADYIFFGGKRIARLDFSTTTVHYYFSDHLGTHSVVSNANGSAIEQESDSYPFGGERVLTTGPNNYKFTSKERDAESSLDFFGARYYASALGRFQSADWSSVPVPVPYADLANPQSLNLYSYVTNRPTSFVDTDGHYYVAGFDGINRQRDDGSGGALFTYDGGDTEDGDGSKNGEMGAPAPPPAVNFKPTITYDSGLSKNDLSLAKTNVPAAVGLINTKWKAFNDDQRNALGYMQSIKVIPGARGGIDWKAMRFDLSIDSVKQSIARLASDIAHDSFHIRQYFRGEYMSIPRKEYLRRESAATRFQIGICRVVGCSKRETTFLKEQAKHPELYWRFFNQ